MLAYRRSYGTFQSRNVGIASFIQGQKCIFVFQISVSYGSGDLTFYFILKLYVCSFGYFCKFFSISESILLIFRNKYSLET